MTLAEERNAFVLRMTGHNRIPFGKERGLIGAGWGEATGLAQIRNWQLFKEAIRRAYGYESERALGNMAGSLWRLIHDMKEGDLVLVPDGSGFHVCEVAGEIEHHPEFNTGPDLGWCRKAVWKEWIPRDGVSNALRRRLKTRQTCVWASDLLADIEEARQGKRREFASDVRDRADEIVRQALHDSINDVGLERLVSCLLRKSGFNTEIKGKRGQKSGDVDVIATYDFAFGGVDASVRFGFQIKQHEGATEKKAIEQIADAMEPNELDQAFIVTTAKELSEEASKAADELGVAVITESELVDWILTGGLEGISV